jgi:hypothetical protein
MMAGMALALRSTPDLGALRQAAVRSRAVALAGERTLPVLDAFVPLLPDGGLRRGTTASVSGTGGATSLALAMVAGGSAAGSWVAAVGIPALGLAGAGEVGVVLERLVLVAEPPPREWATVVAALVDAVDLVLVRPSHRVKPVDVRRLAARARERGSVLVQAGGRSGFEGADLRLAVTASEWIGLGVGHGHLQARRLEVEVGGRRELSRPRHVSLWLPDEQGHVRLADAATSVLGRSTPEPLHPDLVSAVHRDGGSSSPDQGSGRRLRAVG